MVWFIFWPSVLYFEWKGAQHEGNIDVLNQTNTNPQFPLQVSKRQQCNNVLYHIKVSMHSEFLKSKSIMYSFHIHKYLPETAHYLPEKEDGEL